MNGMVNFILSLFERLLWYFFDLCFWYVLFVDVVILLKFVKNNEII